MMWDLTLSLVLRLFFFFFLGKELVRKLIIQFSLYKMLHLYSDFNRTPMAVPMKVLV